MRCRSLSIPATTNPIGIWTLWPSPDCRADQGFSAASTPPRSSACGDEQGPASAAIADYHTRKPLSSRGRIVPVERAATCVETDLLPQIHLYAKGIRVVLELPPTGADVHGEKDHLPTVHVELELTRKAFGIPLLQAPRV